MNLLQVYWLLQNTVESRDKSKDNLVLLYITEGLTVVNIRLIYKQNGNVSWQREGTQKVKTMTSGAQFTTLSLVKRVVWSAHAVINWCSPSVAKSADCLD